MSGPLAEAFAEMQRRLDAWAAELREEGFGVEVKDGAYVITCPEPLPQPETIRIEHEGVPLDIDISPADPGPAWEWPEASDDKPWSRPDADVIGDIRKVMRDAEDEAEQGWAQDQVDDVYRNPCGRTEPHPRHGWSATGRAGHQRFCPGIGVPQ